MDTDQSEYAKDTAILLIELLRSIFGSYFNSYWEAWPAVPPVEADYPLVIVQKTRGRATIGPTSTDDYPETFVMSVWINAADDVGSDNARTTTMRKLQYLVEGQDPVTLDYKNPSIMFALRHFLSTLNTPTQWLIDSDVEVKYDMVPRKDLPTTVIADITVSTQRRVIVSRTG